MSIKKRAALVLGVCVIVAVGSTFQRVNEKNAPIPESTLTEAPAEEARPISAPVKRKSPIVDSASAAAASSDYAKKPEGNIIEFTVVNGLAIAYGDVMLGKVEEGSQIKKGYNDAPTPQLWERAEIPYAIHPDLPQPERVESALDYLRGNTPVRFVLRQDQADAIVFEPGEEHCYSYLGKVGGLQPIKLSSQCQSQEILHEVMHALGFVHEQSRPDRDRYIEVLWQNIDAQYHPQFAIVPDSFLETLKDSGFDYHSLMLYRPDTFALRPDLTTIRSRGAEPIAPIGKGLSDGDIRRLNRLYD